MTRSIDSEPNSVRNYHLDVSTTDTHGSYFNTPIKSARLEVVHGTGQAQGESWVILDITLADDRNVPAGGYRLRGGEFYTLSGEKVGDSPNLFQPIFDKLETYLKENPQDLEKIKEELLKS